MKTTLTNRSNQNEKRAVIEGIFRGAGLVEIAGGTRNTYFGLRGQGVDGYCIRVGIRTFRVVRRVRLSNGLHDVTVGREHYHGKAQLAKVSDWARKLVETKFNQDAEARPHQSLEG